MTVGASIAGSPWSGPREVVVPAGATVVYPLQFKPLVSGEAKDLLGAGGLRDVRCPGVVYGA